MAKYKNMRELVNVIKALADENRLRTISALQGQELCVCQIVELLGLAPSTVSKHMSILKQARLVEGRKEGRWMYYRLADSGTDRLGLSALAWINASLRADAELEMDRMKLRDIVAMDLEVLCKLQRKT
jgi:ArsR family transcriptional regulator